MGTLPWKSGKEAEIMTNAETIQALMGEICALIEANIRSDGECQFDPVKIKLALELVKYEIQKSVQENYKAD